MAKILFVSDLNVKQDLVAALQLLELAKRLRHCGSAVTLATCIGQKAFNEIWEQASTYDVQWIQPSKNWGVLDLILKTPLWMQTQYEVVHFFVSSQETSSLRTFIWLAQLLSQWRGSLVVISLTTPLQARPKLSLKILLAEARIVFCYDEGSVRLLSSLKETPSFQSLLRCPVLNTADVVASMTQKLFDEFSYLSTPFLYAPGFWQDWGHLQHFLYWIKAHQKCIPYTLVLGWNWREKKDEVFKELLADSSDQQGLHFLPTQVTAQQHQFLMNRCAGLLMHQLNPQTILYQECLLQAQHRSIPVISRSQDLANLIEKPIENRHALLQDPVNFFTRAYQQALDAQPSFNLQK